MSRRVQQKANTRAKIKQAAKQAFFQQGVEVTTTREISRLAGVAVGTFFVHFPDKLDLVKEIYFDALDEVLSASVGQHHPTSSPTEYLAQIVGTLFPFYEKYLEFTRVIMTDSVLNGGFHTQQMTSIKQGVAQRFEAVGVDSKTALIFSENMAANYWLVFMECLPSNTFASSAVLQRLDTLNLPFKISFDNAAKA